MPNKARGVVFMHWSSLISFLSHSTIGYTKLTTNVMLRAKKNDLI